MSVHIHCAACNKMYLEADDGKKEKTHYYGLCPKCCVEDAAYGKLQLRIIERKEHERKQK